MTTRQQIFLAKNTSFQSIFQKAKENDKDRSKRADDFNNLKYNKNTIKLDNEIEIPEFEFNSSCSLNLKNDLENFPEESLFDMLLNEE